MAHCLFLFQCSLFLCTYVHSHSPTLCDLAHVCAEVCCACGPQFNQELMGAFRALCLPVTMKSCQTGFSHLAYKTNVIPDFSILLYFNAQCTCSVYPVVTVHVPDPQQRVWYQTKTAVLDLQAIKVHSWWGRDSNSYRLLWWHVIVIHCH